MIRCSDAFSTIRRYKESLLGMVLRILSYFLTAIMLKLRGCFCWCPTSRQSLDDAERRILSFMKKPYCGFFVDIGRVSDIPRRNSRIWTVVVDPDDGSSDSARLPLVLVHGYLCGSALWVLNLESLAKKRTVYSIDLLGYGKSSRPTLSSDARTVELQLVQALEAWRQRVGLERFVILGHSLGAFVAGAYALRHPQRLAHVILEDPWGFSECLIPETPFQLVPWIVATFSRGIKFFSGTDICTLLRAAGILGPPILSVVLAHETNMFRKIVLDETAIPTYFYHCNVRRPSGEAAVKALMHRFPWAEHPMGPRLAALPPEMGLTFIYGEHSFMGRRPAFALREARPRSCVKIHVLEDCGHNLHYEKPDEFSHVVGKVCEAADEQTHEKQQYTLNIVTPIIV